MEKIKTYIVFFKNLNSRNDSIDVEAKDINEAIELFKKHNDYKLIIGTELKNN